MNFLTTLAAASVSDLPLLTTLAAGFAAAWVCALVTQKLGLSPIVGYLIGGIIIGPHTPGFQGDIGLAAQLAEVGVILLMFGVGLHFHLKDLLAVKKIAIPGALVQSAVATILGMVVARAFGWDTKTGIVIGMSMAVASTVVLMRVLMDNRMLDTVHGHVAVGWLIVEDILTVLLLVVIPVMAISAASEEGFTIEGFLVPLTTATVKLVILVILLLTVGTRLIKGILVKVAQLRSRELFTLTVLVFAIAVAAASSYFFGVSMALAAFLAGMAVGQSAVSQQVAAEALPLRDAFAVIFFVSVGMIFNPAFLIEQPLMVLAAMAIVMIGKPLAALVIVAIMGYSVRTALTVAIGLAQIGEFSFILAELALKEGLLPESALSMLVATAILSITVNPLIFRMIDPIERKLKRYPRLWHLLNGRAQRKFTDLNLSTAEGLRLVGEKPMAIVVGYGPVGRTADRLLREAGVETVVADMNMDTITEVRRDGRAAIFGDASNEEILRQAGIERATLLVVTLPHSLNRNPMLALARDLNPNLKIIVRARYIREVAELRTFGATDACVEESEAAIGLARLTMEYLGKDESTTAQVVDELREELEAMKKDLPSVTSRG